MDTHTERERERERERREREKVDGNNRRNEPASHWSNHRSLTWK